MRRVSAPRYVTTVGCGYRTLYQFASSSMNSTRRFCHRFSRFAWGTTGRLPPNASTRRRSRSTPRIIRACMTSVARARESGRSTCSCSSRRSGSWRNTCAAWPSIMISRSGYRLRICARRLSVSKLVSSCARSLRKRSGVLGAKSMLDMRMRKRSPSRMTRISVAIFARPLISFPSTSTASISTV